MLNASMRIEIRKVMDVQILGNGYYHMETEETQLLLKLVEISPLHMHNAICFSCLRQMYLTW